MVSGRERVGPGQGGGSGKKSGFWADFGGGATGFPNRLSVGVKERQGSRAIPGV